MEFPVFKEKFEQALTRNESIVFFCSCEITYSGRAEASLKKGDRILMIKNDRTVVVHQPEGSAAINYMRTGSAVEIKWLDDHLLLKVRSPDNKEFLEVEIFKIYGMINYKLEDGIKQELAGNERDMSDMLKDHPEMISPDFKPLSREEHTKFGFIDVFGHDKKGNLMVVECKRYTASLQCVTQLRRYVEKISELKGIKIEQVKGIMASPSISPNALEMLKKWGFGWKQINPPKRHERHSKHQKHLGEW
jgi:RecB family endonuclease NucS